MKCWENLEMKPLHGFVYFYRPHYEACYWSCIYLNSAFRRDILLYIKGEQNTKQLKNFSLKVKKGQSACVRNISVEIIFYLWG